MLARESAGGDHFVFWGGIAQSTVSSHSDNNKIRRDSGVRGNPGRLVSACSPKAGAQGSGASAFEEEKTRRAKERKGKERNVKKKAGGQGSGVSAFEAEEK